jgi:hypothetical protein
MSYEGSGDEPAGEDKTNDSLLESMAGQNEFLGAMCLHTEKIEVLGKLWLNAMSHGPLADEDQIVLDEIRHALKATLIEKTFDKCLKTSIVYSLAQSAGQIADE